MKHASSVPYIFEAAPLRCYIAPYYSAMTFTRYEVRDTADTLVAVKTRTDDARGGKGFAWHGPDGESKLTTSVNALPLYLSERLPRYGSTVVVAEGEKAADWLVFHGLDGLGTVTGAHGCPTADVLASLRDRSVVLWPDNDDTGHAHMRRIAMKLHELGIAVSIVDVSNLDAKADAADVSREEAMALVASAKTYTPPMGAAPNETPGRLRGLADVSKHYSNRRETIEAKKQSGGRVSLRWGFPQLDALVDDLGVGLYCLHATPGAGKSAFCLQVAANIDAPSLYLTAEMSELELMRRLVANRQRIHKRLLLKGELDMQREGELVEDTVKQLPNLNIVESIIDPVSPKWITETLQGLKKLDADGHALLVIDSLHSWAVPYYGITKPEYSEYQALNVGLVELRRIVDRLHIPVLMICERNRSSMKDGGLSAVAGTRAAEYRSDVVIDLSMDDDEDNDTVKTVSLRILKNRQGQPGTSVDFEFNGDFQSFTEIVQ